MRTTGPGAATQVDDPATAAVTGNGAEQNFALACALNLTNSDAYKAYTIPTGVVVNVRLTSQGLLWTKPASSNSTVLPLIAAVSNSAGNARATFAATASGTTAIMAGGRCPPPLPGQVGCFAVRLWKVPITVAN